MSSRRSTRLIMKSTLSAQANLGLFLTGSYVICKISKKIKSDWNDSFRVTCCSSTQCLSRETYYKLRELISLSTTFTCKWTQIAKDTNSGFTSGSKTQKETKSIRSALWTLQSQASVFHLRIRKTRIWNKESCFVRQTLAVQSGKRSVLTSFSSQRHRLPVGRKTWLQQGLTLTKTMKSKNCSARKPSKTRPNT